MDFLPDFFTFELVLEVRDHLDEVIHLICHDRFEFMQLQSVGCSKELAASRLVIRMRGVTRFSFVNPSPRGPSDAFANTQTTEESSRRWTRILDLVMAWIHHTSCGAMSFYGTATSAETEGFVSFLWDPPYSEVTKQGQG